MALSVAAFGSGLAFGHEGESHDEPVTTSSPSSASMRRSFSGAGESLELTLAYDSTVALVGAPVPLRLFLADKSSNEPFDGAQLELTLSGGEADLNLIAAPSGMPGEYAATATLAYGKTYSLLVDATRGGVSDFFSVDGITLPESAEATHELEKAPAENLSRSYLQGLALTAGAAFIGFLAGRASRHEKKAGAK
jgi:hypothetical protein